MKTVFDNRQCAHVWAQQTQEHGKSSNGQFYFRGATIYSYRDSWPLATFINMEGKANLDDIVLVNDTSYSVTTGKHMSHVRNALSSSTAKRYVSKNALYSYVNAWNNDFTGFVNQIAKDCKDVYDDAIASAAKRKKKALIASDIESAQRHILNAKETLELLSFEVPEALTLLIRLFEVEHGSAIALYKEQQAKTAAAAEQARQEQEARRLASYEAVKGLWLAHGSVTDNDLGLNMSHIGHGPTLLRVSKDGKDIETSRGASFPLDHAIKAFKVIRAIKEKGGSYDRVKDTQPGYQGYYLGHFRIDAISKHGDVIAGCHNVPWESIEHAARVLKIFP